MNGQGVEVESSAPRVGVHGNLGDCCHWCLFEAGTSGKIKLTDRLSEIESQLQATEQEAAQQQRRINTNLLTLHFNSTDITAESSEVTQSIRGFGQLLDRSTAALIAIVGAVLPGLLLLVLAWWIVRPVRRNRG